MAKNNTPEKLSAIEEAYNILDKTREPKTFYQMIKEIKSEQLKNDPKGLFRARLYTNLNLDGRFLSIGENYWTLKKWYPLDQREEEVAVNIASNRSKDEDDDFTLDDDLEDLDDEAVAGLEDDYEELDGDEFEDETDDLADEDSEFDDYDEDEEEGK